MKIKMTLKGPDEFCPYPYIQLDCPFEEYAKQVGAIFLEDFMKKI